MQCNYLNLLRRKRVRTRRLHRKEVDMSRDWTSEELQAASAAMKAMGHMGFEEFCESIKEVQRMELRVNLNGKSRKDLVAAIGEFTGEQAVYMKVPTCAYKIGNIMVGKFGTLTIENADSATELMLERLTEQGYEFEGFVIQEKEPAEPEVTRKPEQPEEEDVEDKLVIEIPTSSMTEQALENLAKIIQAKGSLLKKALGTDNLTYTIGEERICFPWFTLNGTDNEVEAYTQLISCMAEMARNSKRQKRRWLRMRNMPSGVSCSGWG